MAAASDGTRLNLAAQLAQTAADLQKAISARKGKATDPALIAALGHSEQAVRSLAAAVRELAAEVEDDDDG